MENQPYSPKLSGKSNTTHSSVSDIEYIAGKYLIMASYDNGNL